MTWANSSARNITDDQIDVIDNAYARHMRRASAQLRDKCRAEQGLHPFNRPRVQLVIQTEFRMPEKAPVTWRDVVNAVARRYNISPAILTEPDAFGSRKASSVRARYLAMWILYRRGNSYPQIGMRLGGRDHSTVINGIRRIEAMASESERAFVDALAPVEVADELA